MLLMLVTYRGRETDIQIQREPDSDMQSETDRYGKRDIGNWMTNKNYYTINNNYSLKQYFTTTQYITLGLKQCIRKQ